MGYWICSSKKLILFAVVTLFGVVVFINGHTVPAVLPEELLTDNEEQLARLKRENFLESILKHFPFFHRLSEPRSTNQEAEEQNSSEEDDEPEIANQETDASEAVRNPRKISVSSSSLSSSSSISFSSVNPLSSSTVSSSIFEINPVFSASSINVTTPLSTVSTSLSSTQALNTTSLSATLITVHVDQIAASSVVNVSSSANISTRLSDESTFNSLSALLTVPPQMTPTSSVISSSSISTPSPTVPTPPLSSSLYNSISPPSVSSTSFAVSSTQSIAMVLSSSAFVQESIQEAAFTLIVESIGPTESQNERKMPVLPNEKGFGSTGNNALIVCMFKML